jgi:hypothetical protein
MASSTADGLMSKEDKAKLTNIQANAEVNVQSDWNESASTSDAFIKNKPGAFTGATATAAGKIGFVPAPAAGAEGKFLRGDRTWAQPPKASTTTDGFLSKEDKAKLNGIAANAQVNPPVFTGATASAAGTTGIVPAPAISARDKLLKGDGSWSLDVPTPTLPS